MKIEKSKTAPEMAAETTPVRSDEELHRLAKKEAMVPGVSFADYLVTYMNTFDRLKRDQG